MEALVKYALEGGQTVRRLVCGNNDWLVKILSATESNTIIDCNQSHVGTSVVTTDDTKYVRSQAASDFPDHATNAKKHLHKHNLDSVNMWRYMTS